MSSTGYGEEFDRNYSCLRKGVPFDKTSSVYAVKTTGIFCRSGCSSRLPKPENVEFFNSADEALAEGYRPCKRCRPTSPVSDTMKDKIIQACRKIDTEDAPPGLERLARESGLSPSYFQKQFKKHTGLTPKEYQSLHMAEKLRTALNNKHSISGAIYDAGYGSPSRVYENRDKIFAMKPSRYKNAGRNEEITYGIAKCSLGYVLAAFTNQGICRIELGDTRELLRKSVQLKFKNASISEMDGQDRSRLEQVVELVDHPERLIDMPLDLRGTLFQKNVWKELQSIPPGETRSYSQIATAIGRPNAVRAVANACAGNPVAVAVPCHRVVRTDGTLGGYRWGVERKEKLLAREKERDAEES